jgi:hypothetical protein
MVEAQADRVTTGSQYAKERIVKLYGIGPDKITVIRYGMLSRPWLPLVDTEPRQENDHPA